MELFLSSTSVRQMLIVARDRLGRKDFVKKCKYSLKIQSDSCIYSNYTEDNAGNRYTETICSNAITSIQQSTIPPTYKYTTLQLRAPAPSSLTILIPQ